MECPTLIKLTNPFHFQGFSGDIFYFYSNFNRIFYECNSVETPVRRVLQRLIWVCTVSICPTKVRCAYMG